MELYIKEVGIIIIITTLYFVVVSSWLVAVICGHKSQPRFDQTNKVMALVARHRFFGGQRRQQKTHCKQGTWVDRQTKVNSTFTVRTPPPMGLV
jgi:hypothetical protein